MAKSTLRDFRILQRLGTGSFGTVYKVRREADRRIYVLKQVNIMGMSRQEQLDATSEVRILASLESEYVSAYFDSFIDDGRLNIVMEYCNAGDLCQLLSARDGELLPEARVWRIFLQICFGLHYLHSKRVLHRDIKSANVFLSRTEGDTLLVKLGDMGVAKVLGSSAAYAHTAVGTPYYLSPELCEDKPYNRKSDVWALGCVLYELCTLKHPFDAKKPVCAGVEDHSGQVSAC
eukprot:PLAT13367.1.p1 GENE.PLAT13367.1~~PLAT13367.1.p1  ORF type:complete len:233 (-),score=71.72 PLAT13367.1:258-956(-)